jgi:hypothetical protein
MLGSYHRRADPDDEREREQRMAADTRSAAQKWLNDPEPGKVRAGSKARAANVKTLN